MSLVFGIGMLIANILLSIGILNKQEKVTLILVTHSIELANRIGKKIDLRDGRLAELK